MGDTVLCTSLAGEEIGRSRYVSAAVIPDGSPPEVLPSDRELYHRPTTRPGARLPHV
jgi:hypothetical protein